MTNYFYKQILYEEINTLRDKDENLILLLKGYIEGYFPLLESVGSGKEREKYMFASKKLIQLVNEYIENGMSTLNWTIFIRTCS
ncbi:hypothetical protein [Ureibacillus chungkukjangi]|uniref:Uncharacterized protein n=1 Tax=Ureibacillus chungkukjangi TaxID=1202712 RepID=A0A318TJN6_9BACL|nr:hypothetical protein [Ureibacillus chungkukjangi]PYF02075.1 hypothetical protein BJ095_1481 [Ureibacillus chungkukjangi]